MKKIVKLLFIFIGLLVCVVSPFAVYILCVEKTPYQYNKTYLAEIFDKYNLLKDTNEKKIVFIGGSSLPFGLRSDLIEKEFPDYKVVNYGLYGTLGTKFMMDTSKVNINKGDIVVLTPDVNEQAYSLYFNPKTTLQACDGFSSIYKNLSFDDNKSLFYYFFSFSFDKLSYHFNNDSPDPVGIYRHDSFNEYGDIKVDRTNNIMNNGVDSTTPITTTDKLLENEFVDYVNNYCNYVRNKGAKIYFNFSPCNELAIQSSKKTRTDFQEKLDNSIACDLLSNIEDCIIDYRYFYDTNFHLNSSGAIYYTSLIINNLKMKLGRYIPSSDGSSGTDEGEETDIVIPEPPAQDEESVEPVDPTDKGVDFDKYKGNSNDDFVDCFEYRLIGSSYQITGIVSSCLDMKNVILPSVYNGKNVTTINENAFYGCINLENIYIGKTYKLFEEKAFNGCISLKNIYLFTVDGNTMNPPASGLLDGANKSVKIRIPTGSNYTTGYVWTNYISYFEYFEVPE